MSAELSPTKEQERLAALHSYHILDTAAEPDFDDITELASVICGTPVALISLIDKDRQWFKSHKGVDVTETDRIHSFCVHAIETPGQLMEVEDTHLDDRFKNNPLVTGGPNVTFYAGMPLVNEEGFALGSLCVIDMQRKKLAPQQQQALRTLAKQVVDKLELKRKVAQLQAAAEEAQQQNELLRQSEQRLQKVLDTMAEGVGITNAQGQVTYVNPMAMRILGITETAAKQPTNSDDRWYNKRLDGTTMPKEEHPVSVALMTGQTLFNQEFIVQPPGEPAKFITMNATPLTDEQGNITGSIGTFGDITERKVLSHAVQLFNTELQAANRATNTTNHQLTTTNKGLASTNRQLTNTEEEQRAINKNLQATNEELAVIQQRLEAVINEAETGRERFRNMIQASPVAMLVNRGNDLIFEEVNEAMLRLIGKDASVKGKPLLQALPELAGQPILEALYHTYHTGEERTVTEAPVLIMKEGQPYNGYYNVTYTALYEQGVITGVMQSAVDVTGQVNARKAVQESELLFRSLAEQTGLLIAMSDGSTKATYFNQAWVDFTGKPLAELLENGWAGCLHPEDRQPFSDLFSKSFARQAAFESEFKVLSKEDKYHWFYIKADPMFWADGAFRGYMSACLDITDRKAANAKIARNALEVQALNEELAAANVEQRSINVELQQTEKALSEANQNLQASEAKLDQILIQLPTPVVVLKGPGQVIETVNDALLRFWDKTKEEVIGRPMLEIFPELKGQPFPAQWKQVYETGETIVNREKPVMFNRPEGLRILYVDYHYQPLRELNGEITGVLATVIDNTDKVIARNKIAKAQQQLKQALSSANLGTWSINIKTSKTELSPRFREIFGLLADTEYSIGEVINTIDEEYRQLNYDAIENAVKKDALANIEYSLYNALTGGKVWARAYGKAFLDENNQPEIFSGILQDITEQKADDQRKNDFINMVSHELKTPLTSMGGYIQLLQSRAKKSGDTFTSSALEKSYNQVKKMTTLINGFLNMSRLESGKIHLDITPFDMEALVQEVVEESSIVFPNHFIRFAACSSTIVHADHDKIGQVITNFVSNAVKYAYSSKIIDITCRETNQQVTISITDYGDGIRPEDQERIFERYYRVETNKRETIAGFGIGLYLCAEIIARHHGQIGVNSEVGKGSTFWFSLPLQ